MREVSIEVTFKRRGEVTSFHSNRQPTDAPPRREAAHEALAKFSESKRTDFPKLGFATATVFFAEGSKLTMPGFRFRVTPKPEGTTITFIGESTKPHELEGHPIPGKFLATVVFDGGNEAPGKPRTGSIAVNLDVEPSRAIAARVIPIAHPQFAAFQKMIGKTESTSGSAHVFFRGQYGTPIKPVYRFRFAVEAGRVTTEFDGEDHSTPFRS